MKRRWNWSIWVGFLLVLVGVLSYIPFFALFPITRDFPWVNLLLFVLGGALLFIGLRRAFGQPHIYRGKVSGSILTALSVLAVGFFCFGMFYQARQLPRSAASSRVGQKAPDFTLSDQNGKSVTLGELLSSPTSSATRGALLIFYRGHW